MKINGPVQCHSFFIDQIEQGQEGLWCVSLRPNGYLEELAGFLDPAAGDCLKLLKAFGIRRVHCCQKLFVRVSPHQYLFDSLDWQWAQEILSFTRAYEVSFCDYLKVSEKRFSSLMQFEVPDH